MIDQLSPLIYTNVMANQTSKAYPHDNKIKGIT